MHRSAMTVVTAGLLLGCVGTTLAHSPSPAPEPADQLVQLPGYGASVRVPGDWQLDGPYGPHSGLADRLRLESDFRDQMRMMAYGWHSEGMTMCDLAAFSRLTCDAPLDLAAEVGSLEAETVTLPAGEAVRTRQRILDDGSVEGLVCTDYALSDGTDIYTLGCCSLEQPADDWRSLADTIQLPDPPRGAQATGERSLVDELRAVDSLNGGGPAGWTFADGEAGTAGEPGGHAANVVRATLAERGQTVDPVHTLKRQYRDEDDELLLGIEAVHIPDEAAATVLDGYIGWMTTKWGRWTRSYEAEPSFEPTRVADRDVLRVRFGDDAATELIFPDGDALAAFYGPALDHAETLLRALDCDHVDVGQAYYDTLLAEMRRRE